MNKFASWIIGIVSTALLAWCSWASLTIIDNQSKIIKNNADTKGNLKLIDYKLDEIAKDLYRIIEE